MPRYRFDLSDAWQRIAKARWQLGQREQALAAFRESAAAMQEAFEQAPSVPAYRVGLSRCCDRLARWCGLAGDRAGAAAALLEREKLWPNDAEQLRKVADDFRQLAEDVSKGREQLSPAEQAERQRYLAEVGRVGRAADAVRQAAVKGPPP